MEAAIPRQKYLKRIEPFIGKNLIKVFTGQRRVGKSYLLFQLMEEIKKRDSEAKILYINKEDLSFAHIRNADDLNQYVLQNKSAEQKTYIFIDEIQDIENFEAALRSLLLDKNLDLYCTGSNANLLSSDIAGHLSGRYIEIPVYSLSYSEFLQFHQLEDSDDVLEKYLKFGGLPYLIHLSLEDHIVFEYLENVYSTILFRDIINRFSVRNTAFLEQLVLFLASNTGSLFSAKKISDFLKSQKVNIAPNQVQVYIQHLTNAFLIHQVNRYDITGKRLFEIGEKYYFENLGIRNALWGFRPEDRGKILENAIYNHLLTENYKVRVGIIADSEIDFIAEKNGEKIYIQAALTLNEEKTIQREFGNLQKIKDNYPKLLITMDRFSGNSFEGIQVTDLRTFLSGK
ncbi:MAG: ATP-binding protein [Bergeyella sp.]